MDPIARLQQLRRDLDPESADELVEAFFDAIALPAKWRPVMAPFVRAKATEMMRSAVRRIERRAPLPGTPGKRRRGKKVAPDVARRAELDESFYNGSKWVTWGAATIDDHQARIDFLAKQRNGINATIQRHVDAIAMIQAAAATCLNDLEPVS